MPRRILPLLLLFLVVSPASAQRLFRPFASSFRPSVNPTPAPNPNPAPASAPPAPAAAAAPAPAPTYNIKVFYRSRGAAGWRTYGLYLAEPGNRVARHLQDQGYEVYAQQTSEPLVRNPARPPEYTLPDEQTVTPEQAERAFRSLAARVDIAYYFPADGCYARAHLMIRHLQQMGLSPWKLWAFANGHDMQVKTQHHPSGEVTWEYHVAPVVRVRGPGNQHWYVLDPALFNQPVTLEQWESSLSRSPYGLRPNLLLTRVGEAISRPLDGPAVGSGYWPADDPSEGLDQHASATMRKFKPHEGRWPPKGFPGAVGMRTPGALIVAEGPPLPVDHVPVGWDPPTQAVRPGR